MLGVSFNTVLRGLRTRPCRALLTEVEGGRDSDQLHVPPSWGIYGTWCYLCVAQCVTEVTGVTPIEAAPKAVSAERALRFELEDKRWLEVLFQATFPPLKTSATRIGWSLSRERRPDIVLIHYGQNGPRALVLGEKRERARTRCHGVRPYLS